MYPLSIFPKSVGAYTLSFTDVRTVGRACQVSKRWNEIASSDIVWQAIFGKNCVYNEIAQHIANSSKHGSIKSYLNASCIASERDLLDRIQQFTNNSSFFCYKKFGCFFPSNPTSLITVELKQDRDLLYQIGLNDICLGMKKLALSSDRNRSTASFIIKKIENTNVLICDLVSPQMKLAEKISNLVENQIEEWKEKPSLLAVIRVGEFCRWFFSSNK